MFYCRPPSFTIIQLHTLGLINVRRWVCACVQSGFTPLHLAAKHTHVDTVQLLIEQGADVNASGRNGLTPLHLATHYGSLILVRVLLEHKVIYLHSTRCACLTNALLLIILAFSSMNLVRTGKLIACLPLFAAHSLFCSSTCVGNKCLKTGLILTPLRYGSYVYPQNKHRAKIKTQFPCLSG